MSIIVLHLQFNYSISLMIIQSIGFRNLQGHYVKKVSIVQECLEEIMHLVKNDKTKISMVLSNLISIKYKAQGNKV